MTLYRVYNFLIVEDSEYTSAYHWTEAFTNTADVLRFIKENRAEAYKVKAYFLGFVNSDEWGEARHAYDVE